MFDYIIKPAMLECKIEPVRSDHLHEPGKITEQMFREIQDDDFCIAVLTGHNPNVFYELAVAHTIGRPVIVLIEKGELLPFDVRDARCVYYDLKPRPLFDHVYSDEVVRHVRVLEANDWKITKLFGKPDIEAGAVSNQFSFYRNGQDFGNADTWLQLLGETEKVFEIMGTHLGLWKVGKGFSKLLSQKARAGCVVRILMMHPDNCTLTEMINGRLTELNPETVKSEINEMWKFFARIVAECPNISLRQVRKGTLHCQATRTDTYAMYTPYLYSRRRRYSPLWRCTSGSDLYNVVAEEFARHWEANEMLGA